MTAFKHTIQSVFFLLVTLSPCPADYATPFVETGNKPGDVSETHAYVATLGSTLSPKHLLVTVLSDTMQPVTFWATSKEGVVDEALLGHEIRIKAKVTKAGSDGENPEIEILSAESLEHASDASEEILFPDRSGNFVLLVSNQSLSLPLVDITVLIDGKKAVGGSFHVKGDRTPQHNWIEHRFALSPGKHTLRVESRKGKAHLERKFEVTAKHWAVIGFWHASKEENANRFEFQIRDEPIQTE